MLWYLLQTEHKVECISRSEASTSPLAILRHLNFWRWFVQICPSLGQIVFKCLNWSSIFFKKTTLASMKLVVELFFLIICVWKWTVDHGTSPEKRQNMFIRMERLNSFCSNALGMPVGFQGGGGEERFLSFEMTYTLSIESNVLQSFTIWGNPLLSWPFLFILGLPFSLLCVYYWTNILYNLVIYHL